MIQLERHIEILLLRNDCVIVPGLGGFMAHHVEAHYDDSDTMFLPPLRTLGFNPQLTMNDSLLAQSYVEAYDLSYPEALKRLEEEVEELKYILDNDGSYELNDIGVLFVNGDGHLEFTPCESGILTPDLYGLTGVEIEKVEKIEKEPMITVRSSRSVHAARQEEQKQKEEPVAVAATVVEEEKEEQNTVGEQPAPRPGKVVTAAAGDADSFDDKDDETDEEPSIRIPIRYIKYAAVAAVALFAIFCIGSSVDNSRLGMKMSSIKDLPIFRILDKGVETNMIDKTTTDVEDADYSDNTATDSDVIPADDNEKILAEEPEEKSEDNVAETEEKEAVEAEPETARQAEPANEQVKEEKTNYYSIVLASRVTKKNAEEFVSSMKKKGYESARVYTRNNIVRVIFGSYDSEEEAQRALRNYRQEASQFDEAWVYKVK